MKRHKSLQPLSREHHHGLLLCWKIRTGFSKGIDAQRIHNYADWFYANHILPHFDVEEKHVFPMLGNDHPMVIKALEQHSALRRLFEGETITEVTLQQLADKLDEHIRYEERELFPKIQEKATEGELRKMDEVHKETAFVENTEDEFWK